MDLGPRRGKLRTRKSCGLSSKLERGQAFQKHKYSAWSRLPAVVTGVRDEAHGSWNSFEPETEWLLGY